jgi:two-component system NtrC family sensor kinase
VNAGDAIKGNGEISINSELIDDYIQIKISDDGEGINDKNLMKLFDPFFTTKGVGKGTGLGLSISHSIIEKHGGVLSVESQLAIGTVFTIMLPIEGEGNIIKTT